MLAIILRNPGFEESGSQADGVAGANGWTLIPNNGVLASSGRTATKPHTGQYSVQGEGNSAQSLVFVIEASQTVTVVPGQAYTISSWTLKAPNTNCQYNVFYNNSLVGAAIAVQDTWTQISQTISSERTKASTSGTLLIRINCSAASGVMKQAWFDDITMIAV